MVANLVAKLRDEIHGIQPESAYANGADHHKGGGGSPLTQGPGVKIKSIVGEWKQLEFSFVADERNEEG